MSDFETTASDAVTKLQAIDDLVNEMNPQFEAARENWRATEQEIETVSQSLIETLAAIDSQIVSALEYHQEMSDQISERLNQIEQAATDGQNRVEEEVGTLKESVTHLSEFGQELRSLLETQLTSVREQVASVTSLFDATKSQATSMMDNLQSQADSLSSDLQESSQEIVQAGEDVRQAIAEEVVTAVQEGVESVQSAMDQFKTDAETQLDESRQAIEQSAAEAVQQARTQLDDAMQGMVNRIQDCFETMKATATGTQTASETMITAKDVMNSAMKSTNVGLESVVETLRGIKEIFEKIAG